MCARGMAEWTAHTGVIVKDSIKQSSLTRAFLLMKNFRMVCSTQRITNRKGTLLQAITLRWAGHQAPSQAAGMQLHEAIELKEAYSESSANTASQEGWKLLAVAPGANGVTYVFGKPAPEPRWMYPTVFPDATKLTLALLHTTSRWASYPPSCPFTAV